MTDGRRLSEELAESLLESIPFDLTVIDGSDRVIWWNHHGHRIFDIPENTLGRDVRECHPEKCRVRLDSLLEEMKEGVTDSLTMMVERPERDGRGGKISIHYLALRDNSGRYMGCVEVDINLTSFLMRDQEDR